MNAVREFFAILFGKRTHGKLKVYMIRESTGSLVLKFFNVVLVLGTSLLLARVLGAKEYGVYAYAVSWTQVLSILAVMGLNTLLVREAARYKAIDDLQRLKGIIRWSSYMAFVTSIGTASIFASVVRLCGGNLFPEMQTVLWIAMLLVPLLVYLLLLQGLLRGLGYAVEAQIPQTFVFPALFLVSILIASQTIAMKSILAVGLRVAAGAMALVFTIFLVRKRLPPGLNKEIVQISHPREWLKSAMFFLLVGIAGMLNKRVSTVLVGSMLGPNAAGIFDIALRGASLISLGLLAINMPLGPAIAGLYAKGAAKQLRSLVVKSARLGLFISLPVAVVMMALPRSVLLVFGHEFVMGASILVILSIGQLVSVVAGPVGIFLNMTGHEHITALGNVLSILVNVVLNVVFIPIWGLTGSAVANVVSMTLRYAFFLIWAYYKFGFVPTAFG
jgi:O-antigen/teichoic acid export membrane protein